MAILFRNFQRDQNYNEAGMDNYENLLKEEHMKRLGSTEMSPEEKIEAAKKNQAKEVRKQLMERKRRSISKYNKQLKVNDVLSTILSLSGVIIAFIEAELNYDDIRQQGYAMESKLSYFFRILVLISTIVLLYTIIKHHYLKYTILRERQTTSEGVGSSFIRSNCFLYMLLELLINSLICPPGVDYQYEFSQLKGKLILSIDAIMSVLMLLRCYIIIRFLRYFSKWGNMDAEDICESTGCEASHLFMLKSMFKDKPYYILAISITLSIVIFAFAVRTFERPYNDDNGHLQNFDYI